MTAEDGRQDGRLPELVVVDIRGDFDLAVADRLREPLLDALPNAGPVLAFDLCECTHLDSVALGLIVDVHNLARERSGTVILICPDAPHPAVAPINMSSLRDVVSVFPSREDLNLFLGAFAGLSPTEVAKASRRGSVVQVT